MARKGVTQADVITSANALVGKGIVPTAAGIREYLGRGSLTTIQKYFKDWKLGSFKDHSVSKGRLQVGSEIIVQKDKFDIQPLQKKILELEQQCKVLSNELIKRERDNLKLAQENEKLAQNLEQLTDVYVPAIKTKQGLHQL